MTVIELCEILEELRDGGHGNLEVWTWNLQESEPAFKVSVEESHGDLVALIRP